MASRTITTCDRCKATDNGESPRLSVVRIAVVENHGYGINCEAHLFNGVPLTAEWCHGCMAQVFGKWKADPPKNPVPAPETLEGLIRQIAREEAEAVRQ